MRSGMHRETDDGPMHSYLVSKNGCFVNMEQWSRLTQALSGYGCFGTYLAKRGHRPTSSCRLCGEEENDAEHTLFTCPAHDDDRRRAKAEIGAALSKDNLILTMLASQEKWDQIATFIRRVIETKEEKERRKKKRLKRLQDG